MKSALREVAEWMVANGYPFDYMGLPKPPEALCQELIDVIHEDRDGEIHGNELDRQSVEAWVAEEAGWDDPVTTSQETTVLRGGPDA